MYLVYWQFPYEGACLVGGRTEIAKAVALADQTAMEMSDYVDVYVTEIPEVDFTQGGKESAKIVYETRGMGYQYLEDHLDLADEVELALYDAVGVAGNKGTRSAMKNSVVARPELGGRTHGPDRGNTKRMANKATRRFMSLH